MFFNIYVFIFVQFLYQIDDAGKVNSEIRINFCPGEEISSTNPNKKITNAEDSPLNCPKQNKSDANNAPLPNNKKKNTKTVYSDKGVRIIVEESKRKRRSAFTYENGPTGVHNWPKIYPECGGRHQSPVNINNDNLEPVNLKGLEWSEQYFQYPELMTITNNGHTVVLRAKFEENSTPRLRGGPLSDEYVLDQVHFHWGSNDDEGSEHTIDKQAFCMEMHAVHHKIDMNFEDALKEPDGLAVIAYIFEIDRENRALTYITIFFEQLEENHKEVQLSVLFRLSDLIVPFGNDYVTYMGSLTTPPCSESVIWLIAPKSVNVDPGQIQKFRDLFKNDHLNRNYRPTQQINDRTLYLVTDE